MGLFLRVSPVFCPRHFRTSVRFYPFFIEQVFYNVEHLFEFFFKVGTKPNFWVKNRGKVEAITHFCLKSNLCSIENVKNGSFCQCPKKPRKWAFLKLSDNMNL